MRKCAPVSPHGSTSWADSSLGPLARPRRRSQSFRARILALSPMCLLESGDTPLMPQAPPPRAAPSHPVSGWRRSPCVPVSARPFRPRFRARALLSRPVLMGAQILEPRTTCARRTFRTALATISSSRCQPAVPLVRPVQICRPGGAVVSGLWAPVAAPSFLLRSNTHSAHSAPGRNRTYDHWIRSPLLFPLSYGGRQQQHSLT